MRGKCSCIYLDVEFVVTVFDVVALVVIVRAIRTECFIVVVAAATVDAFRTVRK